MGSGTTLVEAKLLGRNAVGVDVNPNAIAITKENLSFECDLESTVYVKQGNAMDMRFVKDNMIDFICTHPPYADIIRYSDGIDGDISLLKTDGFISEMRKVATESYRVLKKDGYCAVMMGDIRNKGKVVPLGFRLMESFLEAGFQNKEIIIKQQHNCSSTPYWNKQKKDFLLLAHEYIFVFQK